MKQKRYFQYLIGESKSTVAELKNIIEMEGETYFEFGDGETINAKFIAPMTQKADILRGKYMVEVSDVTNIWKFESIKETKVDLGDGKQVNVPPLDDILYTPVGGGDVPNSVLGMTRLIPPPRQFKPCSLPTIDDYKVKETEVVEVKETPIIKPKPESTVEIKEQEVVKPIPTSENVVKTDNPIVNVVSNAKKELKKIDMTIEMMLPKKSLYSFLVDNYDISEETMDKYFINTLMKELNIDMIIDNIKSSLLSVYKEKDE